MKRLMTVLETIRSLPKEVRRLLAGLSFVIAALIVFAGWNILIPSRLTALSGETARPAASPGYQLFEKTPAENTEALSPLEGITESFKSLRSVIGPNYENRNGLASITTFFEKAWRYVYDPLK